MNNHNQRVHGKTVVITGAASGLGAAAARALAAQGANLVLGDINVSGVQEAAAELCAAGAQAVALQHNVTQSGDWDKLTKLAVATYGRLDVLVNNAGIVANGVELINHDLETWRRVLDVNLDGVFLGLRSCGAVMRDQGAGSVINISSILGKVGFAGAASYCASKGGVTALTKAAAIEWAPLNIRVNSIHPGFVETPMIEQGMNEIENGEAIRALITAAHPIGRLGQPEEIAEAVVFLASDESRFMTGSELVVDGGYTAQ